MIARVLFRLSRSHLFSAVVRFGFAHLSALLPVRRVGETEQVVAFHHPRPSWQPHILFVPKVGIASLLDVRPEQVSLVRGLIQFALDTASRESFGADGFALLVNGGTYQDVGQLHFHLAGQPREIRYDCSVDPPGDALLATASLTAFHHPHPRRATHIVLWPRSEPSAAPVARGFDAGFVEAAIIATQKLARSLDLSTEGYTLIANMRPGEPNPVLCFHLVSGGVPDRQCGGAGLS
jgi:histidine triad (HIT) family protein